MKGKAKKEFYKAIVREKETIMVCNTFIMVSNTFGSVKLFLSI